MNFLKVAVDLGAWRPAFYARGIAVCLALLAPVAAQADDPYPNKPVRVVVAFGPGGPSDLIGRLIGQKLTERLGKQFYIENHAGAGGNIGTGIAARAEPDGYTILIASSHFTINPSLYGKVPYDPIKDFTPVTLIANSPNVLVVNPSLPVKSAKELVDLVRASPGMYSYAMPGAGTPAHLSGEMFRLGLNLDMVAVPFGGGGPMIQSVVAGHTPIAFSSMPPAAPQIQSGKLRGLAVTSLHRVSAVPDVPTMVQAGYPDQLGSTPQAFLVPAGTPKAIVDLLYNETKAIVAMPDVKTKLAAIGFEPIANTPDEFAAEIKAELPKWKKLIEDANISVQ